MPIVGSIDVADIIANLGDDTHGLRPSEMSINRDVKEDEHIYRATYSGPVDFSTSTVLATTEPVVWDVNGYYRSLGIEWPYRPTKKELRLAYQITGGPDSERLTYHFKQLLNPTVRAEYDKTPLGNKFRDRYVVEEEHRLLSQVASEVSEETGKIVTVEDLINEYESTKPPALPEPLIDDQVIRWTWGYYLLNSRQYETDHLALWQSYLTSAMAERGVQRKISIGYVGNTKRKFLVRQYEGRVIFFLNEKTEPTLELAKQATASRKSRSRPKKAKK